LWRCEHDRLTGRQPEKADGSTMVDLERLGQQLATLREQLANSQKESVEARRELSAIRSSTRYRVGSALAEAARDPVRRLLPTLVSLLRLAVRRVRRTG
jgi:chaperonin cofactor prefoldin